MHHFSNSVVLTKFKEGKEFPSIKLDSVIDTVTLKKYILKIIYTNIAFFNLLNTFKIICPINEKISK